jgi:hypothetical protein
LLSVDDNSINKLSIIFGGDFNAEVTSSNTFKYLSFNNIPFNDFNNTEEKLVFKDCCQSLTQLLKFNVNTNYPFTYMNQYSSKFIIDYLFYEIDSLFELKKVIPFSELKYGNNLMPSKFIPSDHCAIIFEFLLNK